VGIRSQIKLSFFFVLLFLFLAGAAYQEILVDKKKQAEIIEKQINDYRSRITNISSGSSALSRRIDSVESAISAINSFLKNYGNESYMTADQIAIETNMIIYLAEDVERIQESFKQKVVNLYKHGDNYELELLLSSKTPNEYLRRNQYLQKFSQNRKKELRDLSAKKFILEEKKKMLTLSTSSQRFYVESKRNERAVLDLKLKELALLKKTAEDESAGISGKISRLETQLNNVKNFINNFESNKENFVERKTSRINYDSYDLAAIKGNLNLPVDIGLITTNFGNISDNKTLAISMNNGVDLSVAKGSKVYAVAEGIVSLVGEVPFYGKVIIIKHESGYRTVYASLSEALVSVGSRVKLNQVIGRSGETLEGQTLHFELWQNSTPLNPREWLKF
jgi:murein hydrolase activator